MSQHSRSLPSPPKAEYEYIKPIKKQTINKKKSKCLSPKLSNATKVAAAAVIKRKYDVLHDVNCCMFKIQLDSQGNHAALCYLPTRYKNMIEFYHIEIPLAYRNQGLGDLLLQKAFEWVQNSKLLVIPTCSFVLKYLESRFPDQKSGHWPCIIHISQQQ